MPSGVSKQATRGWRCAGNADQRATLKNWKRKYGGIGVGELRRLKQLEEENRKLKQLVADLSLDKLVFQEVVRKKSEARREAGAGQEDHAVVEIGSRRACGLVLDESCNALLSQSREGSQRLEDEAAGSADEPRALWYLRLTGMSSGKAGRWERSSSIACIGSLGCR